MVNWSEESEDNKVPGNRLEMEFSRKFPNLYAILSGKPPHLRVNISFPRASQCVVTIYKMLDFDKDLLKIVLSVPGYTLIQALELIESELVRNPNFIEEK